MKTADKKLVDQWLDAALKQYGQLERVSGLEERVVRRLQASPAQSMVWQRRAAWVAAAIIVIVSGTLLMTERHRDTSVVAVKPSNAPARVAVPVPAVQNAQTVRAPEASVASNKGRLGVRRAAKRNSAARVSWPSQFPSPEPLSEQERLLARYVRERPEEAKQAARELAELHQKDMLEFEKQAPAPKQIQKSDDNE
jgi:hypothetical protein